MQTANDLLEAVDMTLYLQHGVQHGAALPFAAPSSRKAPSVAPPANASGLPFTVGPAPIAQSAIYAAAAGIPARVEPVELAHDPSAAAGAHGSAVAASNAAAALEMVAPPLEKFPSRRSAHARRVEVLWFDEKKYTDPSSAALDDKSSDIVDAWLAPRAEGGAEATARARVAAALADGDAVSAGDLRTHWLAALDQRRDRCIVIVDSDLELRFDPAATAKVWLALTAQLCAIDPRVKAAHDAAAAAPVDVVPGAASSVTQRVRESLSNQSRETRAFVETHAAHALLSSRAFETRHVLGGCFVVAALAHDDGRRTPVYLPDAAAAELPLLPRFRTRAVVEVRGPQEVEASPVALRVLAVGRVVLD